MRANLPSVLVVYNNPSSNVSRQWAESDRGVLDQLDVVRGALGRLGVRHRAIGISKLSELIDLLCTAGEPVVFNLVENLITPANALLVPAVCRALNKVCTGSDTAALLLTGNKWQTRTLLQSAGLSVPQGLLVPPGHTPRRKDLPAGPFIVKPVRTDASEGITADSFVNRAGEKLNRQIGWIHRQFNQPALVEQFVGRRELNVSLLQRKGRVEVLAVAEIDFIAFEKDRPRIVDYSAKWDAGSFEYVNTPQIIPARLTAGQKRRVESICQQGWKLAGCGDYARVDLRLDQRGRPVVLEINTNPDISPLGGFSAACEYSGVGFDGFVRTIIENAVQKLPVQPKSLRSTRRVRVGWVIRSCNHADRKAVLDILAGTQRFRPGELKIAQEVLDDALRDGPGGHYQSYVIQDSQKRIGGWVCFGPTPCTEGAFDVYWLAVDASMQGRGLGKMLMTHAEQCIRLRGGRLAVVETSGREDYAQARAFYLKAGYQQAARLADFYAPGDDKFVYLKTIGG